MILLQFLVLHIFTNEIIGQEIYKYYGSGGLNKLVLGLYVKFVSTFILSLPDEESRNARKCDELSFTAVIPTSEAAPAVSEPALTHHVSVPSEDKT